MSDKVAEFLDIFNDINKTTIMIALLILGAFFRIKGYINGDNFTDLLRTTTVAYFGTATAMNMISTVKDHLAAKVEAIKGQSK